MLEMCKEGWTGWETVAVGSVAAMASRLFRKGQKRARVIVSGLDKVVST